MSSEAVSYFRVFPSSGVPLYRQVMDQVRFLMLSGQLRSGDLLPSVRVTASALEVNPMTVSKAYSLLESEGVVKRIRGLGMRVCASDSDVSAQQRLEALRPLLEQVAGKAHQLGLSRAQVLSALAPLLHDADVSDHDADSNLEAE